MSQPTPLSPRRRPRYLFNILLQNALPWGFAPDSATPAGKRWVTLLQRAPQNCGPRAPSPHDPSLHTLLQVTSRNYCKVFIKPYNIVFENILTGELPLPRKWVKQSHFRQHAMDILPPPRCPYVVKQPPKSSDPA